MRAGLVWLLYAVPVLVAVRPIGEPLLDPDIWWHLRVGEWVVEHRAVTANDPFSQYGLERPWVAYSWGYEVLLHGLYRAFGLWGVIGYRTLMAVAVVAAIHRLVCRLERRFLPATLLTGVAVLAVAMLFSERPWLFTILFTTVTLHAVVVLRGDEPVPRWVWALPLVFVVWANVHIQFVYGLLVLGLGCVAPWIDHRLSGTPVDVGRWKKLALLTGLCALATGVNPYGLHLHAVVVEYATQPGPFRWVNELKALEFRDLCDWVMLGLTLAAVYVLGRRKPTSFEILLLAGAVVLAFRARRDLWFVVLADLVILASAASTVTVRETVRLSLAGRVGFVAALLLLAGVKAWADDLSRAGLQRRIDRQFPVGAAAFVAREGYAGPLYNDFNWGGYLIWALPHLPVSMDGRTNLHGDARIEAAGRVWAGLAGWDKDPELLAAGVVIAPRDCGLTSLLRLDPRFVLAYEDEVACVFHPAATPK